MRLAPGFEQIPQLSDVARGMAVFQAEMGQATLGATFGGTGEQDVQIVRTQCGGGVGLGYLVVSHLRSPKQMTHAGFPDGPVVNVFLGGLLVGGVHQRVLYHASDLDLFASGADNPPVALRTPRVTFHKSNSIGEYLPVPIGHS